MPPRQTTADKLANEKLRQEVRKLAAEAELAELKLAQEVRAEEDSAASEYEHRIYAFNGAVREASVEECITTLGQWSRREPEAPITVVFNSPGGSVTDGLALFDFLRFLSKRGHHITTASMGMAASMGGILLQAGDTRVFGSNAYMLIHEVSSGSIGKVSDMEDEVEISKRMWKRCASILAERSTLTERQIRLKAERKEWWLDAAEALELGFVDEIQ